MKASLLLVLSCFLLFLGGTALATMPMRSGNILTVVSSAVHAHTKQHPPKKNRVKKTLPVSHQQQDSFTEADEDTGLDRHIELQTRVILLFTVACVWAYRRFYVAKPLPFPWYLVQTITSKYILQRVLRI